MPKFHVRSTIPSGRFWMVGDHILEAYLSELGLDSKFNVCTTLPSGSFWMVGDHSGDGG